MGAISIVEDVTEVSASMLLDLLVFAATTAVIATASLVIAVAVLIILGILVALSILIVTASAFCSIAVVMTSAARATGTGCPGRVLAQDVDLGLGCLQIIQGFLYGGSEWHSMKLLDGDGDVGTRRFVYWSVTNQIKLIAG